MKDEIKEILDNIKKCCGIMQDENFVVYQKQDIIKLLDYITNLQEEIKSANDSITWWSNRFNAVQEENKILKEQQQELERYKNIIDKTVEYVERLTNGKTSRIDTWENVEFVLETILSILKGE